jgi:hypothetical protein
VDNVYHEVEEMNEGIDQEAIIKDSNYKVIDVVLEDANRERRMKQLHIPEQPILLSKDALMKQFCSNQAKCIQPELIETMKQIIMEEYI